MPSNQRAIYQLNRRLRRIDQRLRDPSIYVDQMADMLVDQLELFTPRWSTRLVRAITLVEIRVRPYYITAMIGDRSRLGPGRPGQQTDRGILKRWLDTNRQFKGWWHLTGPVQPRMHAPRARAPRDLNATLQRLATREQEIIRTLPPRMRALYTAHHFKTPQRARKAALTELREYVETVKGEMEIEQRGEPGARRASAVARQRYREIARTRAAITKLSAIESRRATLEQRQPQPHRVFHGEVLTALERAYAAMRNLYISTPRREKSPKGQVKRVAERAARKEQRQVRKMLAGAVRAGKAWNRMITAVKRKTAVEAIRRKMGLEKKNPPGAQK